MVGCSSACFLGSTHLLGPGGTPVWVGRRLQAKQGDRSETPGCRVRGELLALLSFAVRWAPKFSPRPWGLRQGWGADWTGGRDLSLWLPS